MQHLHPRPSRVVAGGATPEPFQIEAARIVGVNGIGYGKRRIAFKFEGHDATNVDLVDYH
jgi:hypothetical protein